MMKKFKKWLASPKATVVLFSLSAALLLFTVVGAVRAALRYKSESFGARIEQCCIGVSLLEKCQNDKEAQIVAQAGKLKAEDVVTIMSRLKANQQDKLTFRKDTFEAYFPKGYTAKQMEESIINLLKERKRQLDRRRDEAR